MNVMVCTEPGCDREAAVAAKCFIRAHLASGEQWMQPMGPFEALCDLHQAALPRQTPYECWLIYSIEQAERVIRGEEKIPIEPLPNRT